MIRRCARRSSANTAPASIVRMARSIAPAWRRADDLVHPRILAAIQERLAGLRAEGARGIVVIDAALMLKWGLERECDAVLAVTAPESEQVRRLMSARGWTESEARARLAAQWPDERYAAAADWTIENRGSTEALRATAHEAMRALRSRAGAGEKGHDAHHE